MAGTALGPTWAYSGETGIIAVCQATMPASTRTPIAMIVSPTAGRTVMTRLLQVGRPISAQPKFLENPFDARALAVQKRLVLIADERDLGPIAIFAGLRPLRRAGHLLD